MKTQWPMDDKSSSFKPSPILKYFEYEHLPQLLQQVSKPFCDLARQIEVACEASPEKSAGLRKLLEAKDCIVRASMQ